MHIISIGNDKKLQAVALDKRSKFLKNLEILGRAEFKWRLSFYLSFDIQ